MQCELELEEILVYGVLGRSRSIFNLRTHKMFTMYVNKQYPLWPNLENDIIKLYDYDYQALYTHKTLIQLYIQVKV